MRRLEWSLLLLGGLFCGGAFGGRAEESRKPVEAQNAHDGQRVECG